MQDSTAEYVASKTTYNKMGYGITKQYDDGIKIFIPQFYSIAKLTDIDGKISYKPYFALTKAEKSKYKDKNDTSIVFYKQKLSGFNIGNIFNINDSTMPKEALEELNPQLNDTRAEELLNPLIKAIYKSGFKVKYQDMDGSKKGFCNHEDKLIAIRKGMGSVMQLKVLIHEYAHGLAHKNLDSNYEEYEKNINKYETEAESIAYTVSKYLGAPTTDYSVNYLYSWSKDRDFKEIEDSLSTIVKYSNQIIKNFDEFYNNELEMEEKKISI